MILSEKSKRTYQIHEVPAKRREMIKKKVKKLWENGMQMHEIAKTTGIPESTVRNVLHEVEG